MNHTGVTSVRSRRQALRKRSFASLGGSDEDRAVFELDAVGGDGMHRRSAGDEPGAPSVSSISHRDICTQVRVGVSRSVYDDASLSRSSITRSRNSPGLSPSNATMNSWSSRP